MLGYTGERKGQKTNCGKDKLREGRQKLESRKDSNQWCTPGVSLGSNALQIFINELDDAGQSVPSAGLSMLPPRGTLTGLRNGLTGTS